jgi:hypothetical protein
MAVLQTTDAKMELAEAEAVPNLLAEVDTTLVLVL